MKKILLMLFALLISLSVISCNQDTESLTVMTPAGAPALAQMYVQSNDNYTVDVVSGVDPLAAAFVSGTHDFIFAPTNLGAKLYTTGIEYKFLAAVTFGNYYLVSNQEDDFTIASLEGKDITVFGITATSGIVLQYILSENNVTANIIPVDSVTQANSTYIADNTKIILTAEPSLSVLSNLVPGFKIIDLQDEYSEITGKTSYPQAGVFGKTSLTNRQINKFLDDLEESINKVNDDQDDAIAKAIELNYGFSAAVLETSIPNCHLDYVSALDVKTDLEAYFNIILDMNADLLGNALPEEDFYYN